MEEIELNGEIYIKKSSIKNNEKAQSLDGMPFVMTRARNSGVHAGYMKSRNGTEVELVQSIRIWSWSGAASLSQLATDGPKNPDECKFGVPINVTILDACEVIEVTVKAKLIIQNVPSWKE